MTRIVSVEVEGVEVEVTCDVYSDKLTKPWGWWRETRIDVQGDATDVLRHFSTTKPWEAYTALMEAVEAKLIEQGVGV